MSMFTAEYQDFKREDPTVLVKVTLYDDQKNVIKPAISKAKLVQGTKYAGDYEITQDGNQYCLSTKQVAKLPSGSYGMELWGDDGSIYPSAGFIPIRIHRNADNSLEQVDPTVDLNKIIEDMHNAGLNLVFDKIELLDSDQPGSITSSVHDGKNHITLRIPRGLQGKAGPRGFQGPAGKNFQIKQTFASIEAMNASKGAGFEDGDFALIASDVNDPDNSKFYVWSDANKQFTYMDDLSGAQGIQGPVGPAPTLHVTKVTTVPNGGQPSFTATSVGNGNYNVEIGLPKGDKGDTGSRGYSFWAMKVTAGGNVSGRNITDLYSASASNLPEVNDLVVQPDGNVYSVTNVVKDTTSGASDGGGTFDLGPAIFSIKGDKGNDAVINVISQAEYDALTDKSGVYFIEG